MTDEDLVAVLMMRKKGKEAAEGDAKQAPGSKAPPASSTPPGAGGAGEPGAGDGRQSCADEE